MGIHHSKVLGVFSLIGSLGGLIALSLAIPTSAFAQAKQIQLLFTSQGNQNYETLIRQAEALAGNSIEQAFAETPNITEVSITIVGERNGSMVPLLSSNVSRSNWQAKPTVHLWTRYFPNAEVLLGFAIPQQTNSAEPSASFNPVSASMSDRQPNFYQ
jgi:hypothetical protein